MATDSDSSSDIFNVSGKPLSEPVSAFAPLAKSAAKAAIDSVAYVLLALGLYGVATLALAIMIIPFAFQVDPSGLISGAASDSAAWVIGRYAVSTCAGQLVTYLWHGSMEALPLAPEHVGNIYIPVASFAAAVAWPLARLRR